MLTHAYEAMGVDEKINCGQDGMEEKLFQGAI